MPYKVCCVYNDRGAWCTNREIKKAFFGFGARCCSEYPPMYGTPCSMKIVPQRPTVLPPPPPRPQKVA